MKATEYIVTVDSLRIGSIQYPFEVNLKPDTIHKLRVDVAHHYMVKPMGVGIEKITKEALRDKIKFGECEKVEYRGKIS